MSEYTVLDAIRDIMQTDETFLNTIRYVDGRNRATLMAAHIRNSGIALELVRQYINNSRISIRRLIGDPASVTATIMTALDVSGNFFDPVVVHPTEEQVRAAVDEHIAVPEDTMCTICRENISCATRIRHCGHSFHHHCIHQWFTMNARCPVCRHDIRLEAEERNTTNENSSVHTDEE
jgi:hypothetical protein